MQQLQLSGQGVCSGTPGSFSSTSSFTTTGCAISYCTSKGTTTTYEYINKVALGSISNTSGNNSGYGNYTALSTNLAGGTANTITLTPGFAGTAYREYWNVWIDYNHNGLFTDAGEKVTIGNSTTALSLAFTVPTTALNGATRMRVQMQYGSYPTTSCLTYTYGEVEDYTVNVTGNAAFGFNNTISNSSTEAVDGINLYPNPAKDNLSVEFSSIGEGNSLVNVFNMFGQKVLTYTVTVTEGVNTSSLNTSDLSSGIYIFEIELNGKTTREKFVISK